MTTNCHEAASQSEVVWTAGRIRALGAVTDVPTAAQIFGIGRSRAYELLQHDAFPVPALRFGTRYRIPVAPILAALGYPAQPEPEKPPRMT